MVPKDWSHTHIKDILSSPVKNGFSPNAVEHETGYVILGLGALTDAGLRIEEIKCVELNESVVKSRLKSGDFLVSRSNTPDKVGRSALFRGEIENCSYPDLMMKFRVNKELADLNYIEAVLKSPAIRQYYKSCAAGSSSSMVKITKSVVEKTPLVLPSLKEQREIAKILSIWEKAICATEALVDNSKQLKKALMQQLLTGKKRLLNDNGISFSGKWKEKKIESLGLIYSGGTPSTSNKDYWDGGIDWVTPTDITKQDSIYINSSKRKISKDGLKYSSAKLVPKGTLLICTRATIGEMAITSHEMCTNQGFKNIVPNKSTSIEFIYYLLSYNKYKLISKSSGSTFLELSKSSFESMQFEMPIIDEQQKIAAVLISADKDIELHSQELSNLKEEKSALMQQLLTGKRRMKNKDIK